jgi:hypothetical protein
MKVLIVGCGAVGQVFSLFLQKAGVELGCYDRPAAAEKLKQALEHGGLPLFQIQSRGRDPIAHRLENYQVLTDIAECQRFKPDLIWFTVPSTVYYSDWFREFLQAVPSQRVACFAPEGPRAEFFPEGSGDRLVFGGITFMAWQGDLDGGGGQPNAVNFWRPPLGIPLMGNEKACGDVKQLLKKAGFSVTTGKADSPQQASVTAVMTAFVAGYELAGWSLKAFRKSAWLTRTARASSEAVLGQLSRVSILTKLLLGTLCSSASIFLIAFLLPLLFPFDIEKYLKFHYLKTRDQTITLLGVFAKDGEKKKRPVENIQMLLDGLRNSG